MRLDKYLTICNIGSRKEVKTLIKDKKVKVNHVVQINYDFDVNEKIDQVEVNDICISYKEYYY